MQWVAPSEKDTANQTLENRLWEAADQLRANSGLTSAQYSTPVLGLIFLRFAETRFAKRRDELEKPLRVVRAGAQVHVSTSPLPITPKAWSISRPTRASISYSTCRKVPTSVRGLTRRWPTSKSTIPSSPACCRAPIRSSTARC